MPCKVHIHHAQDGFTSLDKYCTQGRIVLPKMTMVPLLRKHRIRLPQWCSRREKKKWKCDLLSHAQPFVIPWTITPPVSSVHGILQARILEWVAIPFSKGSSCPRDQTQASHIAGRESSCKCKGHRFNPWSGEITRATEQLSPCGPEPTL